MHGHSHPEIAAELRQPAGGVVVLPDQMALARVAAEAPPADKTFMEGKRPHARNWRLAGDTVHKATEGLPEFERDQLRWLNRYASGQNLTMEGASELILKPDGDPYSPDSLYQALTGRRSQQGASLRPLAEAISTFRKRMAETDTAMSIQFVETPLTRRMFKALRLAFTKKRIVFVFGESQTGKSTTAAEYQRRNNHGETIIIRMPTRGTYRDFLCALARRVNVPTHRRESDVIEGIMNCFDESVLLIVDEAHQCMYARSDTRHAALEFIRELHDRRKCGVVLIGTKVLKEGILESKILSQLWRRRSPGAVIQLPDMVPAADLAEFAAAYGLDAAPDREVTVKYYSITMTGEEKESRVTMNPAKLQDDIVRREGLGSWLKLLDDAKDLVAEKKKPITWAAVMTQYCLAQAMERGEG